MSGVFSGLRVKVALPSLSRIPILPIRVVVAVHVVLVVVEAVQPLPRLHEGELPAEGDLLPLGAAAAAAAVPVRVGAGDRAVEARAAPARVEHKSPARDSPVASVPLHFSTLQGDPIGR